MRRMLAIAAVLAALALLATAGTSGAGNSLRVSLAVVSVDSSGATYSVQGWQSGDVLSQTCTDQQAHGTQLKQYTNVDVTSNMVGPLYVFSHCSAYVHDSNGVTVSNTVKFAV